MAEQQEHSHAYMHEHGIPHEHSHGHTHSHTQTRAVVNRLARAIGHLEREIGRASCRERVYVSV